MRNAFYLTLGFICSSSWLQFSIANLSSFSPSRHCPKFKRIWRVPTCLFRLHKTPVLCIVSLTRKLALFMRELTAGYKTLSKYSWRWLHLDGKRIRWWSWHIMLSYYVTSWVILLRVCGSCLQTMYAAGAVRIKRTIILFVGESSLMGASFLQQDFFFLSMGTSLGASSCKNSA